MHMHVRMHRYVYMYVYMRYSFPWDLALQLQGMREVAVLHDFGFHIALALPLQEASVPASTRTPGVRGARRSCIGTPSRTCARTPTSDFLWRAVGAKDGMHVLTGLCFLHHEESGVLGVSILKKQAITVFCTVCLQSAYSRPYTQRVHNAST